MKVPDGWKEVKLGDILTMPIQNGYSPVCQEKETGRWVLSLGALTGYSFDETQKKAIPVNTEMKDIFRLKENDILISRSNTIDKVGRVAIYRGEIENCFYPDLMMRFRVDENRVIPEFIEKIMQSSVGRLFLEKKAAGTSGSMVKINKQTVSNFSFVYPPIDEQKKMIEILSVWDNMIEKMEQLIAKKEEYFMFLMKQCFNLVEAKKYVLLADITKISKGLQLSKIDMLIDGKIPVINGGIEKSGYTDKSNQVANTITISEGGNSCGFVNYITEKFWAGGHCYTVIPTDKKIQSKYLYWYLKSKQQEIMKLRVGSGLPNIQCKDLEKIKIGICSLDEQNGISELLDTAHQEIDLLKQLVTQYKLQKQGLMQKLLTGQWRIK